MELGPKQTAASLVHLLNTQGQGDYIGEPVSQLGHSLQAAYLAKSNEADEDTIIAALLHDIGQILPESEVNSISHEIEDMKASNDDSEGSIGRIGHEHIGAEYLRRLGFSGKVSFLVGSHIEAKRYLCAVEPGYYGKLSTASKKTLSFQGGPMQATELDQWAANPWCGQMCQLRKWDDAAKVVGLEVKPADAYRTMIERHLAR